MEDRSKEIIFNSREFLGEGLSAIHAEAYLNKYVENNLLKWVSIDSNLSISDGNKVVNVPVDLWDSEERQASIDRLDKLVAIMTSMRDAIKNYIPKFEALQKEAEDNRAELDKLENESLNKPVVL